MFTQKDRLLTCLLTTAITLCLIIGNSTKLFAAERRTIWESRDQFVALETQEPSTAGAMGVNNHPANIEINTIKTLLGAIGLKPTAVSETTPLFTKESLQTLAPYLQQGVQQAKPGEDITFAIISLHRALLGLANEPRVTTGRLFIRDGKLNLIVGLAQKEVNEREDRRLAPFTPGSRQTTAAGEWQLQAPVQPPGYTLVRRDWVTVATNWQPSPPADTPPRVEPARSPAERLSTLNDLKSKGLITDEEFRSKRQQILNEL